MYQTGVAGDAGVRPRAPGRGSIVWDIAGNWTMLMGGGRALILQVAHPVVAAGVEQHSNYRSEPWQRLLGTLDLFLTVVFGSDDETPEQAGARLRERHKEIKGVMPDGDRYHALDPAAFLWVHASLVDSTVEMQRRFGERPLTRAECERYYEEMRGVGGLYGLRDRDMPPDWRSFRRYFNHMVHHELRDSDTLQAVIASILRPPKPPVLPLPDGIWDVAGWPAFELARLVTAGSLPPRLRDRVGLDWSPQKERLLNAAQGAIRRTFPHLPARLRLMPPALAAHRRESRLAA